MFSERRYRFIHRDSRPAVNSIVNQLSNLVDGGFLGVRPEGIEVGEGILRYKNKRSALVVNNIDGTSMAFGNCGLHFSCDFWRHTDILSQSPLVGKSETAETGHPVKPPRLTCAWHLARRCCRHLRVEHSLPGSVGAEGGIRLDTRIERFNRMTAAN